MKRVRLVKFKENPMPSDEDKRRRLEYLRELRAEYQNILETLEILRERDRYQLKQYKQTICILRKLQQMNVNGNAAGADESNQIFGQVHPVLFLPCRVNDEVRVQLQLPDQKRLTLPLKAAIRIVHSHVEKMKKAILNDEKKTDFVVGELTAIQVNELQTIAWYRKQEQLSISKASDEKSKKKQRGVKLSKEEIRKQKQSYERQREKEWRI